MFLQQYLFPLLTLLLLVLCLGERCRFSIDCNDNLPCSLDYCDAKTRRCINISSESSCNTTRRAVSRAGLIRYANSKPLSLSERQVIIRNAARILKSLHPHRLLHINLLGVDPAAELKAYREELLAAKRAPSNVEFHERMFDIFQKMDDFHTVYLAPTPLIRSRAFLPFTMREYYEDKSANRSYVVSDVALGFKFANPSFGVGSIITKWNGEPIDNVVVRLGKAGFGSNEPAQIVNGMHDLYRRFLAFQPFPKSDSVTIHFIPRGRKAETVKVDWIYATAVSNDTKKFLEQETKMPANGAVLRYDEEPEYKPDTRIYSSDPGSFSAMDELMRQQEEGSEEEEGARYVRQALNTGKRIKVPVNESFCGIFTAEVVPTSNGVVGRLILSSFFTALPLVEVILEFARVLQLMPSTGLIVDVRANGGGFVALARFFTDLLTSKVFEFTTYTVRATALTEMFVNTASNATTESILQLRPAMKTARPAGNPYLNTIKFNLPAARLPNVYNGSYVILADGLTYSAGDLFTAIHKDNDLAPVVIVGGNVGAGGSTVRDYSDLSEAMPLLFPKLPGGVDFRTSFFRLLRTGESEGAILENFGVEPDMIYRPTLRDRLENDKDLFEVLAKIVTTRNLTDIQIDPSPESSPESSPEEVLSLESGMTQSPLRINTISLL